MKTTIFGHKVFRNIKTKAEFYNLIRITQINIVKSFSLCTKIYFLGSSGAFLFKVPGD